MTTIERSPSQYAERIFNAVDDAAERGFYKPKGDRYEDLTNHILGLLGTLIGIDGTASEAEIAYVMEMARPFQPHEPRPSETAEVIRKAVRRADLARIPEWFRGVVDADRATRGATASDALWCLRELGLGLIAADQTSHPGEVETLTHHLALLRSYAEHQGVKVSWADHPDGLASDASKAAAGKAGLDLFTLFFAGLGLGHALGEIGEGRVFTGLLVLGVTTPVLCLSMRWMGQALLNRITGRIR